MHSRDDLTAQYFAKPPDVVSAADGYTGFAVGNDLNREIVVPGTNTQYPEGAIVIRTDGNFWIVGVLPFEEYKGVSIEDIQKKFWPELTDVKFYNDTGKVSVKITSKPS